MDEAEREGVRLEVEAVGPGGPLCHFDAGRMAPRS